MALPDLGIAWSNAGRFDLADDCLRRAVAVQPDHVVVHDNFLFSMHFNPTYSAADMLAEARRRWQVPHADPLKHLIQPHENNRNPERPLRIGYLSPDFRDHVVGRNLVPLFQHHDRDQFHSTCYFASPEPDEMTGLFRRLADSWRDVATCDDDDLARQIRADKIDILVDLTLHMPGNRLLAMARKPAPVQATFAGYPGTTGLAAIDYRISDPYLDPPGMDESVYSEKTIRLADSFWCYDPLENRDLPVNALPALRTGAVTFGCLNSFFKVNAGLLELWAKVLTAVPTSRLMLLAPEGNSRLRVREMFARHDVALQRIDFVGARPRPAYLKLYHDIDIALDSLPYNGHTTSLDCYWMGVPVVTNSATPASAAAESASSPTLACRT